MKGRSCDCARRAGSRVLSTLFGESAVKQLLEQRRDVAVRGRAQGARGPGRGPGAGRLYADRAARRDRDHRHPGVDAAAGTEFGQGVGARRQVSERLPADRDRFVLLQQRLQRIPLPVLGRADREGMAGPARLLRLQPGERRGLHVSVASAEPDAVAADLRRELLGTRLHVRGAARLGAVPAAEAGRQHPAPDGDHHHRRHGPVQWRRYVGWLDFGLGPPVQRPGAGQYAAAAQRER